MKDPLPPEVFRLQPQLPLIIGGAGLCFVLFGALATLEEGLGPSFIGVGLLMVVSSIPLALCPFAALNDDHMRSGRQVFPYSDIVGVFHGVTPKGATATLPKHSQPFLLIQLRQSDVPKFVRVAHIRGGVAGLQDRLYLRLERVRDADEQQAGSKPPLAD